MRYLAIALLVLGSAQAQEVNVPLTMVQAQIILDTMWNGRPHPPVEIEPIVKAIQQAAQKAAQPKDTVQPVKPQ